MDLLVNLDVDDLDKARAFYCSALGLKVGRRFGSFGVELLGSPVPIYLLAKAEGKLAAKARLRTISVLLAVAALAACTDGATRIAYDIESGVKKLERSGASRSTIRHVPEAEPGGCAGPYKVQFAPQGALVIWCKDAATSQTIASHLTSYHLRFVDVPQDYMVDKGAGEPLLIELERRGTRAVVAGVR